MPEQPLVVCWGIGQDSSGALVGLKERGIKPTLVVFAQVGSERQESYALRHEYDNWMERTWGIRSVDATYQPSDYKHWPPYFTLLENCLTNVTLPSLAYGYHTCSAKWKIAPINKLIARMPWAQAAWAQGMKIRKLIGFDDSPHEIKRAVKGSATFALSADEKDKYDLWFALQEWHWTRDMCVEAVKREGLPVLPKSSCFFCPAMKPAEVDTLCEWELKVIVVLEARVRESHLAHAEKKGWPRGAGVPLIEGLWRRRVLGRRGATPKPGSMTDYIREHELLPSFEIDRIIAATPTRPFSQADFESLGYANWRQWLHDIVQCDPPIGLPEPRPSLQ
jgi:hypothetical protein